MEIFINLNYKQIFFYFLIILTFILLSYIILIIYSVFSSSSSSIYDNYNIKYILNLNGSPLEVTKRYFIISPYIIINRKGKKLLCKDGGRTINICSNLEYLNNKVNEIVKILNNYDNNNNENDKKEIIIETENEFLHHVLIEIILVLLQLIDLGLDTGTKFCQKKSTNDGYISVCKLIPADFTKED